MKKLTVMMLCLGFIMTACAQTSAEKDVAKAVETLRKAMLDGNRAGLENIAAADLSYGHSSGRIQNKQEFVNTLVTGESDFVTLNFSEQTIKVVGETALVRHRLWGDTNDGGKPGKVNLGILLVFQKQKGEWKLLARQAYKI
ncbi:nuclear transport factor 2 family protein [Pedobacter sp. BS3]|uniref:nuclear transport factor 2 family protein n=1 Tax=Pedobacter sp. BS3 TaxID=2567937 RepID=UPI0011EC2820|nr:nuclear transport factor 2 family protein [Pedobacter sp. BS3]TZF84681.1 nuclear transport factor 2 family protein [Pedobacter sp. BS3]